MTTIFPEIRLKRFLEMRGADGGPWNMICALPALWVGLLYDRQALDEAEQLMSSWTTADMLHMQVGVLLHIPTHANTRTHTHIYMHSRHPPLSLSLPLPPTELS